ncbi:hypothetical protein CORC01_02390 [Colletotrichum orchidophilum]|uniref:Uncharacterized protein n=1 Tax=Colletotrichum orchidophilum TaxID=1209926 RepID=A0A1G4BM64_9PEZI|nr:uncharacterized protein CORC01_02390 [Colletotrichum orchidophilum]OHF02397.1 hypothetical protein CORC01_02390 [Colletotrichum orchidophilum]
MGKRQDDGTGGVIKDPCSMIQGYEEPLPTLGSWAKAEANYLAATAPLAAQPSALAWGER